MAKFLPIQAIHDYPTKRCTRVLIFAPPARRMVAVRATPGRGPADRAGRATPVDQKGDRQARGASKMAPASLARFGSMTRGSSGGATQIRQARGGIKNFEVMWYMGLKTGPLNGLLWVFRVFFDFYGGLLVTLVGYYHLDMDHTNVKLNAAVRMGRAAVIV